MPGLSAFACKAKSILYLPIFTEIVMDKLMVSDSRFSVYHPQWGDSQFSETSNDYKGQSNFTLFIWTIFADVFNKMKNREERQRPKGSPQHRLCRIPPPPFSSALRLGLAEDFPVAFGVDHLLLLQILDFLAAEVDQPAAGQERSISSWAARCLSSSAVM